MLGTLYSLAVFVPSIAIGARRLHDINKTGWLQLIGIIPIIGWIILIVWAVTKGDVGPNTYGAEPKLVGAPIVVTPPTPPTEPTSPN
jgi:uncharacterized membrane protein YhaH (DUF805 family)